MSTTISINVPMNRVEGDLEVRAELADGVCRKAWCAGTMFRGIERILIGRGPLDGLVITPRICGICSTAHLTAAAKAVEELTGAIPPAKAVALRNVALAAENLQSDVRQTVLTFAVDFTAPAYQRQPLYQEAVERYQSFAGRSFREVVRESKRVLELIAVIGGQWPHSTFMVPGGITSLPAQADLLQCRLLLERYRRWYEGRILGCTLEEFAELSSVDQLEAWLDARPEHRESELGFLLRFGRAIGLDRIGAGIGAYLSFGAFDLPLGTAIRSRIAESPFLVPAGFVDGEEASPFEQAEVLEHIGHSWYRGPEGGAHPWVEDTLPYATGDEGKAYSWAKAPRYGGRPAETGPLAEAVVSRHPLLLDLLRAWGSSALVRQVARLIRTVDLLPAMTTWLEESLDSSGGYRAPGQIESGQGVGLTQAARGALGHWVRLEEGRIAHYQIITPTAWNASPRDDDGCPGPLETALAGTPVANPADPVELGHVVRSFDPCLVCTVHTLTCDGRRRTQTLGAAS